MKIRHRIILWGSGVGLLAILTFSLIVFAKIFELPNWPVNAELGALADTPAIQDEGLLSPQHEISAAHSRSLDTSCYWIRALDSDGKVLYQSRLAQLFDLPLNRDKKSYLYKKIIPHEVDCGHPVDQNVVIFKVHVLKIPIKKDKEIIIQVAKHIDALEEELVELGKILCFVLLAAFLLLAVLGYKYCRILKPVGMINRHAKEITDQTLDQRIPLDKNHDQLYTLTNSLNRMFDRLQYSFARQKEFVASASHELKSPITLLMLFMEDAEERQDLPDSFRQQAAKQADTLRRMSRLVKNLLNLSTLELNDCLNSEECDLPEMLRKIIDEYEDVLDARQISIEKDIPDRLTISGDRDTLYRVLVNLLDNAIRYNSDHGRIIVNMAASGKQVIMTMANTGQLIPPAERELVFEQFYRVEKSRSQQLGGSGLGLAIVKRIIELHKGRIEIVDEQAGLTKFQITLPHDTDG